MKKKSKPSEKQPSIFSDLSLKTTVKKFLWQHWFAIIIVALGTWFRVFDLPNRAILFPDAGRDLLVAAQAVQDKTIPLLGIPSSVPRFKQGPLTIWLQMVIFQVAGYDLTLYSLVFATIGVLALVLIYETGIVYFNRRVGQIALITLAFSPMAIAHSRMPYHTTPIPLFTIGYWWGLQAYLQDKKWGMFWAALSGALLFQFELSMFPVLLAIPILMFIKKHSFKLAWRQLGLGFGLGLLPQIVFDLQNHFSQLGGFAIWIGYRIVSFFIPSQHSFGVSKVATFIDGIATYAPRLWAVDVGWNNLIMLGVLLGAIGSVAWKWHKTHSSAEGLLLLLFVLISVGYFVHGSPSEAYYPIYFVLLPLLLGAGLPLKSTRSLISWTAVITCLGLINLTTIMRHNFFVSTAYQYNYGPSYFEQQLIARGIRAAVNHPEVTLGLANGQTVFLSSFDHLQWVMYARYGQAAPRLIASATDQSDLLLIPTIQLNNFTDFHSSSNQRLQFTSQTIIMRKVTNDSY